MLSYHVMGVLALCILWINTILIVLAAGGRLREITKFASRLRTAEKNQGDGEVFLKGVTAPSEPLFRFNVKQVGHKAAGSSRPLRIIFHDQERRCEVFAGQLDIGGTSLALPRLKTKDCRIWVSEAQQLDVLGQQLKTEFQSAYAAASRAKGFQRELDFTIPAGSPLWIFGSRQGNTLNALTDEPLLISARSPLAWCRAKSLLLFTFICTTLGATAICTFAALQTPIFGLVSTLGAGVGILVFLLVQPLGVTVRDAALFPENKLVGGHSSEALKLQNFS